MQLTMISKLLRYLHISQDRFAGRMQFKGDGRFSMKITVPLYLK